MIHKYSNVKLAIVACYLPPENSDWGRNADDFYAHLISELYLSDADYVIIGGDFNAKTGDLQDLKKMWMILGLDQL